MTTQITHIAHTAHETYKSHESYKSHNASTAFRTLRVLLCLFILQFFNFQFSIFNSHLRAQDITVTVTPVQPILPPQIMLYITEPSSYFNISLTNTGKDNANIYLAMQVEQVNPSSGLSLSTPAKRQPKLPIVVPAGGTHIMTPAEVRGLFNHIPLKEIQAPMELFENYENGSFGLLPEGQYELHFTAYRWDPSLPSPVVASSPSGGVANFSVCYQAQAPEFLTPMAETPGLLSVADMNPLAPQFTWKAPVVACNPGILTYTYSLRIVELLPGQQPDKSMDSNPVVYQANNLSSPMCIIPPAVIKQMKLLTTYAAQITATSANKDKAMLNYVSIVNNGKSSYKLFRLNSSSPAPEPGGGGGGGKIDIDDDEDDDEGDKDTPEPDPEDEDIELMALMGDTKGSGEIDEDSLYTYRNPKILSPVFLEESTRKVYLDDDINLEWDPVWHLGGEGTSPDDNKFEYEVRLYDGGDKADREATMESEPIYKVRTTEKKHTIEWKDLEENVTVGDYLLVEVKPIVTKGESIAFSGEDNILDFGLVKHADPQYFQCSAQVVIEDTEPTSKSANDLKGKVVYIGEYEMTIDDIKGSGAEGFSGTGRVEWKPFGFSFMVCVKFDKLKINKDDIVYDGIAESVPEPKMLSSAEVVDKLFDDFEDIMGDVSLPYANQLKGKAKSEVKSLAEKVNIGEYYAKLQKGKEIGKLLTTGKMDKVYTPIRFPEEVLPKDFNAVDLQIAGMKFAATYATMNIVGEAIMPECKVLESKVLLFGAPRICISPNHFLPEAGHIALLGDFTLKPSTDIEMTFKAPKDLMTPTDGCYISWKTEDEKTKLELLGVDIDMKIEGLVKEVDGKPTDERPVINLQASVGSWNDFLVDNISIEKFQVKELPGWTFEVSEVFYDHSETRNPANLKSFPTGYKKTKAVENDILKWQGLHIGKVEVGFPTSLELGAVGKKGDKRLWVGAEEMFWDNTGVTVTLGAENIFEAKEGTLGGWGISLKEAHVQIIQDDFDNCGFSGEINIPLLKKAQKDGEEDKKDDKRFGNVDYSCEIRNLTPAEKRQKGERSRYSYIFLTENVGDLDFSFLVGQATLEEAQTYFLVEAWDNEKEGQKAITQVELCMGGTIGIGLIDDANDWLKKKSESLPLELKIPDIHFTKMRLSNVKRDKWNSQYESEKIKNKRKGREDREKEVQKKAKLTLMASQEHNIGTEDEPFYIDLGEWSLASAPKHIGPFSFNLSKFSPSYTAGKVTLEMVGAVGLLEDKINVEAGVVISAKVNTKGSIKDWSIEDGEVDFKKISLDLDFTAIHLHGDLEAKDTLNNKGYIGTLDIAITGFFELKCQGGYLEHKKDEKDKNDSDFSWGFFKASIESGAGIHIDPVVINRISGGFFFNCRPTKGKNKFDGTPTPQNGMIGIAFGLGLSTTAGEQALSADLDMLVVYDTDNKCFSTFMLNGNIKAVSGMIDAKCSLIYENEKDNAGKTANRYLCLNVTAELGADTKALIEKVKKANAALEKLQDKLNEFQADLEKSEIYQRVTSCESGLSALSKSGNYEGGDEKVKEASAEDRKELGDVEAGKAKLSLEFKVTWVKDHEEYKTPKWHLYLGEPAKDKRCQFIFLRYKGVIVKTVDIGADAYLCIGNELPDGGALPAIPSKITKFLSGEKQESTDMGADLGKAERSRKAAAKKMLDPNSCEGGVMLGASAWGNIEIDLGLLYGSLDAIAGFDVALVHYGNNAFCVNSGSSMGHNGWYAMGQLYAYLAAELGLHIHIGSFINEKVQILQAGIGGVLEMGLPNPTWIEGSARIKISLLGGLCKVNKKFDFAAGDHCVPFKGNALDGFEMFQSVSYGSDSLYQALFDPTFAVSLNEAKNMTFTTTSSIGSHYRLVDPSWESELKDKEEVKAEDLEKSYALNASRTYVFDMDQNRDKKGMKMGVRLFDLGEGVSYFLDNPEKFRGYYPDKMLRGDYWRDENLKPYKNEMAEWVAKHLDTRELTVGETSVKMQSKSITSKPISLRNSKGLVVGGRSIYLNKYGVLNAFDNTESDVGAYNSSFSTADNAEVSVSFREEKGTTFHLTNMDLKPGHSYMLLLSADAYEIQNGTRVWCQYYSEKDKENYHLHWQQKKAWFFRVKSEEQAKIVTDSLRDLEPYVALAYPSTNGTRVVDYRGEGSIPAYFTDIMNPTIALNQDIRSSLPTSKMQWVLEGYTTTGDTLRQTRYAVYRQTGNCINLEPVTKFNEFNEFSSARSKANKKAYDFKQEQYRLRLNYTYHHMRKDKKWGELYNKNGKYIGMGYVDYLVDAGDSTCALVDLYLTPLPHHLEDKKVDGEWYTADNWLITTTSDQTEPVAYSKPFVGGCIDQTPTIEYETDYFKTDKKGNLDRTQGRLTDWTLAFTEAKFQGFTQGRTYNSINLPYRLIDPYLYFAYLGKWVFIGDREISAYSFDPVDVKFGSETLIFNYNGTTVNCEFLKDKKNKTLLQLRNQMYDVWNTWNYVDSNHPKYPLPSVGGTIGGVTAANQDGKASTVTPLNINYYTDYTYVFEDLVNDYLGAYEVANDLCNKLKTYSNQLVKKVYLYGGNYGSFSSSQFDNEFNSSVQAWSGLHRGQYIESSSRGYTVRVPFYQLPLIFGDCFGDNAARGNIKLNRSERTFTFSIGKNDFQSSNEDYDNLGLRWNSAASNLLFFRLNEGAQRNYTAYGYSGMPFGTNWEKFKDSYVNSVYINWDEFDVHKALQAVTGFKARLYRVDTYDIQSGLYQVSTAGNHRGGGPWEKTVNIGTGNATAGNMDKMYEAVEEKNAFLETHFDKPREQAIWCPDKKTLVFLVSNIDYGNAYGEKILNVSTVDYETITTDGAADVQERKGWYNWAKNDCVKVIFDSSFKNALVTTAYHWFYKFSKLKSVEGLANLPSTITDMSGMFYGCTSLTSLDLKGVNLSNVEKMYNMFSGCTSLTTLDFKGASLSSVTDMGSMFKDCTALTSVNLKSCAAPKVETMFGMFSGCTSLTSARLMDMKTESLTEISRMFSGCKKLTLVDLTRFNTSKVKNMYNMFENCESLTSLNLSSFEGGSVRQATELFYNCKQLSSIDMSNFDTEAQERPSLSRLFAGCKALRTLHMDALNPKVSSIYDCQAMFDEVTKNLTCYYHCDLNDLIADQIPGTKKPQPDLRAKVIHGRDSKSGVEALYFINSSKTITKNSTYAFTTSITNSGNSPVKTSHTVKVLNVWYGDDVYNTGSNKPKWATTEISSAVKNIYIDDGFSAAPRSTVRWFYDFSKVTEIQGLANLKTDKVTNMAYMFYGCSSLESVNLQKWEMDEVTDMSYMFYGCKALSQFSYLPASYCPKVKYMNFMFYNCESLTRLPVYGGENVTNMAYMYYGCSGFEYLSSPPTITTDKVTSMSHMFMNCTGLRNTFKFTSTANVTDMNRLYANCGRLREINMGQLNTEKVKNMEYIFDGCKEVYLIDLGEMSSKSLTNYNGMFSNVPSSCTIYIAYDASRIISVCPESSYPKRVLVYPSSVVVLKSGSEYKLHFVGEKITMKKGDTYNRSPYSGYAIQDVFSGTFVQNRVRSDNKGAVYKEMWNKYASNVTEVTIDASFKKVQLINAYGYFKGMERLTSIKGIGNLDTKNTKDLGSFFSGCKKLTSIEGSAISTASATSLDFMFYNCESLASVNAVQFGSSDIATNCQKMFYNCKSLKEISMYNCPHTGKAHNLSYMFYGCESLTSVPLTRMNTDAAQDMTSMFEGCKKLKNFSGLTHFNVEWVCYFENMFKDCTELTEANLSTWNTTKFGVCSPKTINGMFANCPNLRKVTLGSNFTFDRLWSESSAAPFKSDKNVSVIVPKENLSDVKSALTGSHGFVIGTTGQIYDNTATETAQLLWTSTNKTITFFYGMPVSKGSSFNGYTVTAVWSGDDVLKNNSDSPKWASTVQSTATTVVFDNTFTDARPTSTRAWFTGCKKLTTIKGFENLTTSSVTNMSRMFMNCESLTSLEFTHSGWSTANVTEMNSMFSGCKALTSIDLSKFSDTRKVQNIGSMFSNCQKLKELDLTKFSTAAVTNANYLFNACYALKILKVGSNFTCSSMNSKASYAFSSVSNMEIQATSSAFNSVKNPIKNKLGFVENPGGTNGEFVATDKMVLQAIWTSSNKTLTFYYGKEYSAGSKFNGYTITNVWKFSGSSTPWLDTVKGTMTTVDFHSTMANYGVSSCYNWFKGCEKLTTVRNISNLKTSSCGTFSSMFYGCKALTSISLGNLDVSKSTSLYCMFYNCEKLSSLDVSKWNTAKVTSLAYMFYGCKALKSLDVSNWNVSSVQNMSYLFSGCTALTTITGLDKWNTVNVTNMSYMFNNCEVLSTFNPTNFNTSKVTNMSYMFNNCKQWVVTCRSTYVAPKNYNVSNVTNMEHMFAGCSKISRLELPNWKTSNVTNMSGMFTRCTSLAKIDFSGWDTKKVTTMADMFFYCTAITNVDLKSFNTPELTTMKAMFKQCFKLSTVNLSSFDLSKVSDMSYMFYGCKNGPVIDLRVSKKIKSGVSMYYIFYDTWDSTEKYGGVFLDINDNFLVTTSQNCGWPTKPDDYFNYCPVYVTTNHRSVVSATKMAIITTMKNMGYKGAWKGEKPSFLYKFSNGKSEWIEY